MRIERLGPPTQRLAYSTREAAATSSLSERQIAKAIAAGELKSVKKGRRRLILAADLKSYLRG